jgi:DNA-binding NarL/FixJ family response regulator
VVPGKNIRVALVEDHEATRGEMERILTDLSGPVKLVGVFSDAEALLASLASRSRSLGVDVVLMDLGLPGMSGIDAIQAIADSHPNVRALALTVFDDAKHVFDALVAGAFGYLLKDEAPERIVSAIEEAAAGAHPISSRVAGYLVTHARKTAPAPALSDREDELAILLAEGCSYAECATRMSIAVGTVQDYVKRLYRKLDVNSRAEVRQWVSRRMRA